MVAAAGTRRRKAKPKAAVKPQFISIQDLEDHKNVLIYGDSGSGKTVFAGSADDVLFISCERNGAASAKAFGSDAKVWRIKKWADLEDAYNWLMENPDHGFKWVVLDSLTQMQQMALRAILDDVVAENASRDLDVPAIQDHQKWQNMFKRFVLAFCDLDTNCLFTALALRADDEEGEPFLTPDIAGKGYQISQYVCGQMSAYGYLKVVSAVVRDSEGKPVKDKNNVIQREEFRRIIWKDTGKVRGKDRYNVLAPYTQDKTLQEISDMIDAGPPPPVKRVNRQAAARRSSTTTRRRKTA